MAPTVAAGLVLALAAESRPALDTWAGANGKIAFTRFGRAGSTVHFVGANGKGESRFRVRGQSSDAAWSPDGNRIVFTARVRSVQGVYVASARGGGARQLTRNTAVRVFDGAPSWSPDGRTILFQRNRPEGSGIYRVSAAGGTPQRIGDGFVASYSPDGTRILFAFRPRGGNLDLYVARADGSGKRRLTSSPSADFDADWSPDGERIVFVSERDGDYEVYVMQKDGSRQRRLTRVRVADVNPVWSPDGRQIAFASRRFLGQLDVFVMDADGRHQRRLTRHRSDDADPSWQRVARR